MRIDDAKNVKSLFFPIKIKLKAINIPFRGKIGTQYRKRRQKISSRKLLSNDSWNIRFSFVFSYGRHIFGSRFQNSYSSLSFLYLLMAERFINFSGDLIFGFIWIFPQMMIPFRGFPIKKWFLLVNLIWIFDGTFIWIFYWDFSVNFCGK